MSALKDLIPLAVATMAGHGVRGFDGEVVTDSFGTEMIYIRGHSNDLRFCDTDKMFSALSVACVAEVTYGVQHNDFFIRPLRETVPGTIEYRFVRLMEELDKRFPKGAAYRSLCAEPPEAHLLREIDAYMTQRLLTMTCPRCHVEMAHGIAIDPKHDDKAIYMTPRRPLPFEDVDLIVVWKCPKCGLSDDGK